MDAANNLPVLGASSTSATGRTPLKQVHTHSARDLRGDADTTDDEEGKISTSPSSRSPTVSPTGSPSSSPSWRSFIVGRTWMPNLSIEAIEDALPAVALTLALGALLCAVMVLSRSRSSTGGR